MTDIEHAVRKYLGAMRVTLWGDFDLTAEDSFEHAVKWLTRQVTEVNKRVPLDTTPPALKPHKGQWTTAEAVAYHAQVDFDPYRVDL